MPLLLVIISFKGAVAKTITEQHTWTAPPAKSLKRVSGLPSEQRAPTLLNNLDCTLIEYRKATTSDMRQGCFTETELGLMEGDGGMLIFNGTDEGMPILPIAGNQILAPWPEKAGFVALSPVSTGGTYISLYNRPLVSLKDQRDWLLRLHAKQMTAPPDSQLKDSDGERLVINPQTLTFSDDGDWLVAETISGNFVRINLTSLEVKVFAKAYTALGRSGLSQSHIALSQDGRWVAIANKEHRTFKLYDLNVCSDPRSTISENCRSYDYQTFIDNHISGISLIKHVRFINNDLLSFEALTSNSTTEGIYLLAPSKSIASLTDYIALGDSYTSGEGAFNYVMGTDTAANKCHLSAHSYPQLIARELFNGVAGHSVACSGAVIRDVSSTSREYQGQVRDSPNYYQLQSSQKELLESVMAGFMPGFIAQQRFVSRYQPKVITVSAGGNDIGFGDIIEQCLTPRLSVHRSNNDCFSTYEDRLEIKNLIDRTTPKWISMFRHLAIISPESKIYTLGYPDIVYEKGRCGLNVRLSKGELQFARELVDYINQAIHKASNKAKVNYIDITKALEGHRLCETKDHLTAVNGLTAGKDSGPFKAKVFGRETYHPNALGHRLIQQAILRDAKNFTVAKFRPDLDSDALLKKPKTGRIVKIRSPEPDLTSRVLKQGGSAILSVSGIKHGLKPNTAYQIRLKDHGLQTATTDNEAALNTVVKVPATITPGGGTIDIVGDNQNGEQIYVTQPIYVPDSDTDFDGDGEPDATDSCPTSVNSSLDADQDGIDDACDGFIGSTTSPERMESSISSHIGAAPLHKRQTINVSSGPRTTSSNKEMAGDQAGLDMTGSVATRNSRIIKDPGIINWHLLLVYALLAWLTLMFVYIYAERIRAYISSRQLIEAQKA